MFTNLVKGLEQISYPYVVNRHPDSTSRIWVHNDVFALPAVLRRRAAKRVVGPNLFVMPRDIPALDFGGCVYITPSTWMDAVWRGCGFDSCPTHVWPVGVDTDEFRPAPGPRPETQVLLYHKRRDPRELAEIERTLEASGLTFRRITYGHYTEAEYRDALARAAFVVWHGRPESQGLALQEALASDVPLLVCDARTILDAWGDDYEFQRDVARFPATAAPYFDETCGVKINNLRELKRAIERMRSELKAFSPREFVLRNLSLEGQARAFVGIWDEAWTPTPKPSARASDRPWRPNVLDVLAFRVRRRLHLISRKARGI